MLHKRSLLLTGGLFFVLGQFLSGCVKVEYTCVGCHTDQTLLEEIAAPINYPTSGGEG